MQANLLVQRVPHAVVVRLLFINMMIVGMIPVPYALTGTTTTTTTTISMMFPMVVVEATYSIIGTHLPTTQIGGAGASCVQDRNIGDILYHGVPGHGILATQAAPLDGQSEAVAAALAQLAQDDVDAAAILQNMNELDNGTTFGDVYELGTPDYEFRQNAIVNFRGQHAAWTGNSIQDLYPKIGIFNTTQTDQGGILIDDGYTFSAQANVVTDNTVPLMVSGFTTAATTTTTDDEEECDDLAHRLMMALEAVSQQNNNNNEEEAEAAGDVRCLRGDIEPTEAVDTPAAGGFLKVQASDGTYVIDLNVIGDGTVDPTIELRQQYDTWRANNPCPGSNSTADNATTTEPPPASGATTEVSSSAVTIDATALSNLIMNFAALAVSLGTVTLPLP